MKIRVFHHKRAWRAFTLIELLVVIAIVAILAALLFPLYMSAKTASQTAKCLSHERELYGALMMYCKDYNDTLPNETFLAYSMTAKGKYGLFMPYVKNTEILICQKYGSYGYNIACKAPLDPDPKKLTYAWVDGVVAPYVKVYRELDHGGVHRGRPLGDVKRPGCMMVFICGLPGANVASSPDLAVGTPGNGWEWEPHDVGQSSSARLDSRHNGGTTFCFLDGHAACLLPSGRHRGFVVATNGLDYDGDGLLGDNDYMR
jgi:prepilin-type N-terminal cleavage/methylation domain-containing protein/prepilin-type processing-associated H-X9-DG protein